MRLDRCWAAGIDLGLGLLGRCIFCLCRSCCRCRHGCLLCCLIDRLHLETVFAVLRIDITGLLLLESKGVGQVDSQERLGQFDSGKGQLVRLVHGASDAVQHRLWMLGGATVDLLMEPPA